MVHYPPHSLSGYSIKPSPWASHPLTSSLAGEEGDNGARVKSMAGTVVWGAGCGQALRGRDKSPRLGSSRPGLLIPSPHPMAPSSPFLSKNMAGGREVDFLSGPASLFPPPALSSAVPEGLFGQCVETSNQKPGLYRSYSQKGHEEGTECHLLLPTQQLRDPLSSASNHLQDKATFKQNLANDSGLNRYRQRNQGTS